LRMSWRWLPNAISLFRIALIAPVLILILDDRFDIALVLFFLAGFSDSIDGYLAKRFDWRSRVGALLDPIADKLLMAGTYITLAWTGHIPIWIAAIVVFRDIVIIGGATAYNFLIRPIEGEPTRISKLNTGLELLFIVFVLSRAAFDWPDPISVTIIGASVLVTVSISGIDYVISWSGRARSKQTSDQA